MLSEQRKKELRQRLQEIRGERTGVSSREQRIKNIRDLVQKRKQQEQVAQPEPTKRKPLLTRAKDEIIDLGSRVKDVFLKRSDNVGKIIEDRSKDIKDIEKQREFTKGNRAGSFLQKVERGFLGASQIVGESAITASDIIGEGARTAFRALPGDKESGFEGQVRKSGRDFLNKPFIESTSVNPLAGFLKKKIAEKVVGKELANKSNLEVAVPVIQKATDFVERHPYLKAGLQTASGVADIAGVIALPGAVINSTKRLTNFLDDFVTTFIDDLPSSKAKEFIMLKKLSQIDNFKDVKIVVPDLGDGRNFLDDIISATGQQAKGVDFLTDAKGVLPKLVAKGRIDDIAGKFKLFGLGDDAAKKMATMNPIGNTIDDIQEFAYKILTEADPKFKNFVLDFSATDIPKASQGIIQSKIDDIIEASTGRRLIEDTVDTAKTKFLGRKQTKEEIVGQIAQGKTKDIAKVTKALDDIDFTNIKTFKDLDARFNDKIKALSKEVDDVLLKDNRLFKSGDLALVEKVGGKEISTDFVSKAIDDLEELFTKSVSPADAEKMRQLRIKLEGEGLSLKEVNDLAREYGKRKKGFNLSGTPSTSVTKQGFENVRKGLKETTRRFNRITEKLDARISSLIQAKELSSDMVEKVNRLAQKVKQKNLIEKVSKKAADAINLVTAGGPRQFLFSILGLRNQGFKTLNALDLQEQLPRLLKQLDELAAIENADVFVKQLDELFK